MRVRLAVAALVRPAIVSINLSVSKYCGMCQPNKHGHGTVLRSRSKAISFSEMYEKLQRHCFLADKNR